MGILRWDYETKECVNAPDGWRVSVYVEGRTWRYTATNRQEGATTGGTLLTADGFADAETAARACEYTLIGCGVLDLSPKTRPGEGWVVATRPDENTFCSGCGIERHLAAGREWRVLHLTLYMDRYQCETEKWNGVCSTEEEAVREGMAIARALAQLEVQP